ncbi:MAG: hypothetical protein K0Q87_4805 [Neobacillus sp.]|jgi:hypothetical protein|nr:hypothetical protein [Neobacillus sp.]
MVVDQRKQLSEVYSCRLSLLSTLNVHSYFVEISGNSSKNAYTVVGGFVYNRSKGGKLRKMGCG